MTGVLEEQQGRECGWAEWQKESERKSRRGSRDETPVYLGHC